MMQRLRTLFLGWCLLTAAGCGAKAPVCTGGLCGQKMQADCAMFVKPELVAAEPMEIPVPGKITVVDFWEICCDSCVRAMPGWEALWQRMDRSKAVMVGISLDDDVDAARRSLRGEKSTVCPEVTGGGAVNVTFPMLYDGEARALDAIYNVGVTRPVTVVLDEDGTVIFDSRRVSGDAVAAVESLLSARGVLR